MEIIVCNPQVERIEIRRVSNKMLKLRGLSYFPRNRWVGIKTLREGNGWWSYSDKSVRDRFDEICKQIK